MVHWAAHLSERRWAALVKTVRRLSGSSFSNDLTNIPTVSSPYHKKGQPVPYEGAGEPLTDAMIQASVDEAAGVDAHLLQPGWCWVPWWKSKIYPAEEHYRWVKEKTGHDPDPFGKYVLAGGDVIDVFVRRCHERGRRRSFLSPQ